MQNLKSIRNGLKKFCVVSHISLRKIKVELNGTFQISKVKVGLEIIMLCFSSSNIMMSLFSFNRFGLCFCPEFCCFTETLKLFYEVVK